MTPKQMIKTNHRSAFTLVELLVVIAIIAILASLTGAAVMKVLAVGKETKAVTEIRQLDMALNTFKQKMNVREVPCRGSINVGSTFTLKPNYGAPVDLTGSYEYKFLKQLFPAAELASPSTTFSNGLPDVQLDSAQLICFWLGGYYYDSTAMTLVFGQGFNADARFPFLSAGPAKAVKGPIYDFPANRLQDVGAGVCPRYLDPWGTPYCFFSTENGRDNNYGDASFTWMTPEGTSVAVPLLTKASPLTYAMPKTFQIFSAGDNKLFPYASKPAFHAPLTVFEPGVGAFDKSNAIYKGGDDFSNIYDSKLGVPK